MLTADQIINVLKFERAVQAKGGLIRDCRPSPWDRPFPLFLSLSALPLCQLEVIGSSDSNESGW